MTTDSRGSGALLALAVMGAVAAVLALILPLSLALVAKASTQDAADASALAAADVAAGIAPGIPCRIAASVAKADGASLESCEVDGLVVTVSVTSRFAGFTLRELATAGPP